MLQNISDLQITSRDTLNILPDTFIVVDIVTIIDK